MNSILLLFLQLGIFALLMFLSVRTLVARQPRMSIGLCIVTQVISILIVVLWLLDIPRLGICILQENTPAESVASMTKGSINSISNREVVNAHEPLSSEHLQFSLIDLLKRVETQSSFVGNGPFAWLAIGFVAMQFGRLLNALRYSYRLRKTRLVYSDPGLLTALAKKLEQPGTCRSFRIYQSDLIDSPCITWLSSADIYVPHGFEGWSSSEQSAAIAHEIAHAIRGDARIRLLYEIGHACVCFQPVFWLMRAEFRFAQERATDLLASKMLTPSQYLHGLARLALKMDSSNHHQNQLSSVSVFTNTMIRRISMLQSKRGFTLGEWARCISVSLVAASACAATALYELRAEEPTRIAKNVLNALPADSTISDSSTSWQDFGSSEGHLVADPKVLSKLPMFQALLDELEAALHLKDITQAPSIAENLSRFEASFTYKTQVKIDHDQSSDHKYRINASTSNMQMTFDREFNWAELADKLNFKAFASAEKYEPIKALMKQAGTSSSFVFLPNATLLERDAQTKPILSSVDGGCLSVVCKLDALQGVDMEHIKRTAPATLPWWNLIHRCDSLSVGLHFSDAQEIEIRMMLAPLPGQDLSEFDKAIYAALHSTDNVDAASLEAGGTFFKAASQFRRAFAFYPQSDDSPHYALVVAKLPLSYFQNP